MKRKFIMFFNLLKNFFVKCRYYSFSFALYDLIWWLCFYIRFPSCYKCSEWAIKKKTKWLDKYIKENYSEILEKYHNNPPTPIPIKEKKIWVFWGQGEKQMPPLVEACYRQLKHFNGNVILVTTQNVNDYIQLSPLIMDKVKKGCLPWANYSDIIRMTLLAKYGGLWVDATVWVSGKLPMDKLYDMVFWTPNSKILPSNDTVKFWTSFNYNWSTWCLWTNERNGMLFSFVSELLQNIAIKEKYWLDYVLFDYAIFLACREFPEVNESMKKCQGTGGSRRGDLAKIMNDEFNNNAYQNLISSDCIFKLSFRTLWVSETENGKQTFYGRILQGIIP